MTDEQMIADIARAMAAYQSKRRYGIDRGADEAWNANTEYGRAELLADARAAHSVIAGKVAELTDERDHLQRCLRVAYPYISDKAGAGILSAIDAALAPYPERRHD